MFRGYLTETGIWDDEKLEYHFGDPGRNSEREQKDESSFLQEKFICNVDNDHRINIAKNASLLWETSHEESINYGNLIHEILSEIITADDIDEVLEHYSYIGILSEREKATIKSMLLAIVNHPKLASFYEQNNKILNEQEIIGRDKNIIIPDRIVIKNEETVILDYKTGVPSPSHKVQLENYGKALEDLGFQIEQKLLVYIDEEIVVVEV